MSATPRRALWPAGSASIGVIVPCRNEARVIRRRLANLALSRWPTAPLAPATNVRPHRIVVVDDHSSDGTFERAVEACAAEFGSRADVVASVARNGVRPGKPGAVQAGVALLEAEVDLIVLTDADVVHAEGALVALERAFAEDPRLALACGAQRFVRDLARDGTLRSAALGPLADAADPFDRITTRVRALESRCGMLFSVHGQLLAWRAGLGLLPRAKIAADDLDLMLQARARAQEPRCAAIARVAIFCEVKTPEGPERRAQALRRARAYVQLVRSSSPHFPGAATRLQWLFYRRVPLAAPGLTAFLPLASVLAAWMLGGPAAAIAVAIAFALLLTSPPGWRWVKLALLIAAAKRRERESALSEQWEMARR